MVALFVDKTVAIGGHSSVVAINFRNLSVVLPKLNLNAIQEPKVHQADGRYEIGGKIREVTYFSKTRQVSLINQKLGEGGVSLETSKKTQSTRNERSF